MTASALLLLCGLAGVAVQPDGWGSPEGLPPVSEAPPPDPNLVLPPTPVDPPPPPVAAAPPVAPAPAPAPPATEDARYRVVYGLLGELGHIQISFVFPGPGGDTVQAVGEGSGSLLGIGQYHKRVEAQLDAQALTSRRWVMRRVQSGRTTTDSVEQPRPGTLELVRRRSDRPDEGHSFVRQQAVLDPLGFLYRVRSRPPRAAESFEVLDGRALWAITLEPAPIATLDTGRRALTFRGRANPIFWNGEPDNERTARHFTLWLSDDAARTPLRLVMPLPVGEVRVDLTTVRAAGSSGLRDTTLSATSVASY